MPGRRSGRGSRSKGPRSIPFHTGQDRVPFRRWRSAVRQVLRERYRKEKGAQIELTASSGPTEERSIIMASVLAKGVILKRYNKCGKPRCRCSRDGQRHGPYWYLALPLPSRKGATGPLKTKQFYLNEEEALALKARIKNFQMLQQKVLQELYNELIIGGRLDKRVLDVVQSMG